MTAIYIIDHTDPANGSFTINPNKLNGPGSVSQNTNLSLYGAGSLRYGEGMNENILHLLENFASPEATSGSPAVGTGLPDLTYFNPAKAVKGQLWFNSSTNKLMMYDGSNWISAGGTSYGTTAPPTPSNGDLWYDTNAPAQLKIYDGTWTSVADRYVLKSGDAMTDFLTLHAPPSADLHAATKKYVDDNIAAANEIWELTDVADTTTSAASTGEVLYFNGATWENYDIQADLALKLNLTGGTLSGLLTLSGDPSTSLQAATKQYVDGHSKVFTSTTDSFTGTPKNGDVGINTTAPRIFMYAATAWRQVWPAQYA